MSRIDIETKRKLREMGVATLLDAFEAQDDTLTLGLAFEEKIKLAVDDAHWRVAVGGTDSPGRWYPSFWVVGTTPGSTVF